jgi:hypothetical protein
MAIVVSMAMAPGAGAITCEECLEIDKQENLIQTKLNKLTRELKEAFNNSKFNKVTEIRGKVNELRKKLILYKRKGQDCSTACKPEQIKNAECHELKLKIRDMESQADHDTRKVDRLYRDLARCNNELARM